jgi:hypothetical protein
MAKTIIIIEDIDAKTAKVDVQVMTFATLDGTETGTPAMLMATEVKSWLATHRSNYDENAMFVPMQSAARH